MNRPVCIFEDSAWPNFLPLAYTRPLFDLVCGSRSFRRRAERLASAPVALWCRDAIAPLVAEEELLSVNDPVAAGTMMLNGRAIWSRLPDAALRAEPWIGIAGDADEIACVVPDDALAARMTPDALLSDEAARELLHDLPRVRIDDCARLVDWPWELVRIHQEQLLRDLSACRALSARERPGVHLLNPEAIRIAEDARIDPCVVIDAREGPVFVGDGVRISPMCTIQGPAYIGDGTLLQPGATIRHASWIGPVCKVGGEIEASIMLGYSNKQHDGFLGHSLVGSWVNIAADCINSDLKNTYGTVRVPLRGEDTETGELFVGALIGDHAKIGINASLPTGCVVGFSSSVVAPLLPKFVPSFAWHQNGRSCAYDIDRAVSVARRVMERRKRRLTRAGEDAIRAAHATAMRLEKGLGELPERTLAEA